MYAITYKHMIQMQGLAKKVSNFLSSFHSTGFNFCYSRFTIRDDSTRVAVFRYNGNIDTENQVSFSAINNIVSKQWWDSSFL